LACRIGFKGVIVREHQVYGELCLD
jgi:hypothetical protein